MVFDILAVIAGLSVAIMMTMMMTYRRWDTLSDVAQSGTIFRRIHTRMPSQIPGMFVYFTPDYALDGYRAFLQWKHLLTSSNIDVLVIANRKLSDTTLLQDSRLAQSLAAQTDAMATI